MIRRRKVVLPNGIGMAELGPSSGTKAERAFRMIMVRNGIRHRSQVRWGPDGRWRCDFKVLGVLVDVHGSHWHGRRSRMTTLSPYWRSKLEANLARDKLKAKHARQERIPYAVFRDWEILSKDRRERLCDDQVVRFIKFVRARTPRS